MWKQYADNKPVHQRLASLKPHTREKFQDTHSVELALYNAAVRYLDELKASGKKIAPKHWQTEVKRLTAQMKSCKLRYKDGYDVCITKRFIRRIPSPRFQYVFHI